MVGAGDLLLRCESREWIEDPDGYLDRFRDAIGRELEGAGPARSVPRVERLAAQLPEPLGTACGFVLRAPRERVPAMREAREEDLLAAIKLLDPSELLATLARLPRDLGRQVEIQEEILPQRLFRAQPVGRDDVAQRR